MQRPKDFILHIVKPWEASRLHSPPAHKRDSPSTDKVKDWPEHQERLAAHEARIGLELERLGFLPHPECLGILEPGPEEEMPERPWHKLPVRQKRRLRVAGVEVVVFHWRKHWYWRKWKQPNRVPSQGPFKDFQEAMVHLEATLRETGIGPRRIKSGQSTELCAHQQKGGSSSSG
jgi:hypothetical protein